MIRSTVWITVGVLLGVTGLASMGGGLPLPQLPTHEPKVLRRHRSPSPHLSAQTVMVKPSSGRPGTVVTVTGYDPAAKSMTIRERTNASSNGGNIYFGGIVQGLDMGISTVVYSNAHPGEFTLKFRLPTVPWLTSQGEHPLLPGRYRLLVSSLWNCTGPAFGDCQIIPFDAQGTFTLTGPIPVRRRAPVLHFYPDRGAPGTTIHVRGWAPLTTLLGNTQPASYQLVWDPRGRSFTNTGQGVYLTQAMNGALTGAFQVPPNVKPLGSLTVGRNFVGVGYQFGARANSQGITLAPTPFTILAPKTWASLGNFQPEALATNQQMTAFYPPNTVTASGSTMAVVPTMWVMSAGKWTQVGTKPLAKLAHSTGYPAASPANAAPGISSVTLVPGYPRSLFVAMEAEKQQYRSTPPMYNTPYYSTTLGATWRAVPVPRGYTDGDFGGYVTAGSTVAAYFSGKHRWTAEVTQNGGVSWSQTADIPAPPAGPALVFGPVSNGAFPMGGVLAQQVLRRDGAGRWVPSASMTFNPYTGTTTLVAISAQKALLIEPGGSYPVQITENGGKTWSDVALPPLPHGWAGLGYPTLGMLANGDLLQEAINKPGWFLLQPGHSTWTQVPASLIPSNLGGSVTISGASVWWVANPGNAMTPPTVDSVPQSRL